MFAYVCIYLFMFTTFYLCFLLFASTSLQCLLMSNVYLYFFFSTFVCLCLCLPIFAYVCFYLPMLVHLLLSPKLCELTLIHKAYKIYNATIRSRSLVPGNSIKASKHVYNSHQLPARGFNPTLLESYPTLAL
jgi:hypothetical protein